jgi:uncharacterized protein
MKIEIQHIPSNGTTLSFSKVAKDFAVLKKLEEQGECRLDTPLMITLNVVPERDMIKVKGTISTTATLSCSRCLEEYQCPIDHSFILRFSRQIPTDLHDSSEGQVELTADQIGLIYFYGDEIDFKDSVQEQMVLALPIKPLCGENCKGLCQHCGANLNDQRCICGNDNSNSPFAVLIGRKWPTSSTEK